MALIQVNAIKRGGSVQDLSYLLNIERIITYFFDNTINNGNGGTVIEYTERKAHKYPPTKYEVTDSLSHFNSIGEYIKNYKYIELNALTSGISQTSFEKTIYVSIMHIVKAWEMNGKIFIELEDASFDTNIYQVKESLSEIKAKANSTFATLLFDISVSFELHNSNSFSVSLDSADTYYLLNNENLYLNTGNKFSFSNDIIQYEGDKKIRLNIDGAADIEALNKQSKITFAIFKNESVNGDEITPTDFTSLDRLKNISTTAIIDLEPGDQLSVRAKSSVASNNINIVSFHRKRIFYRIIVKSKNQ